MKFIYLHKYVNLTDIKTLTISSKFRSTLLQNSLTVTWPFGF